MRPSEMLARAMVQSMIEDKDKAAEPAKALSVQARVLKDILPDLLRKNPFQVGDLIEQIAPYEAYRFPALGSLAIVTQVENIKADERHFNREDIAILCLAEGKWIEVTVESWRFKKYEGQIEGRLS